MRDPIDETETQLKRLLAPERIQANFERLWNSIELQSAPSARPHWGWPISLAAALMLAFTSSYFAVSLHFANRSQAPAYQTLADNSAPMLCGQVRVRFTQTIVLADLQSILLGAHSHIVDGPSRFGTFTLQSDSPDVTLQQLRQYPQVLLAEPVDC